MKKNVTDRHPEEELNTLDSDKDADNGTMPGSAQALRDQVIGHRIVKAERAQTPHPYRGSRRGLAITLDSGKKVFLAEESDCCAYTEIVDFVLHANQIDHIITGVGTTGKYTRWHIYADLGDVLELQVGWSAGNPFYYGYGFDISVVEEYTPL